MLWQSVCTKMKCKYVQCNGIMQQVMSEEVQPLLKLQLKLSEASDRLAVSKVMPHIAQSVIDHAYISQSVSSTM